MVLWSCPVLNITLLLLGHTSQRNKIVFLEVKLCKCHWLNYERGQIYAENEKVSEKRVYLERIIMHKHHHIQRRMLSYISKQFSFNRLV